MKDPKENYRLYITNAYEMIEVAKSNLGNNYYSSACNRAYYAIFYATSALLYSKGKSYGKHSAVIAAFRQNFIKTGEFAKKWSDVYEYVMSSRHSGDYELSDQPEKEQVMDVVEQAQSFVAEVEKWLLEQDLL